MINTGIKNKVNISVILLIITVSAVMPFLFGCSSSENNSLVRASLRAEAVFTDEEMARELSEFMNDRTDRTPFSDGEKAAAEYIAARLGALDGFDTATEEVVYRPYSNDDTLIYKSQNVVSVRKSGKENAKAVIIGANYDNQYSSFSLPAASRYTGPQVLLEATRSSGAYVNGTGTAALLALAEKIAERRTALDFDLYVVFFGCGELGNYGARSFVESYLTAAQYERTLLMINLQRLGGDNLYVYGDEVQTDHIDYIFDKAGQVDIEIDSVPNTLPRMPAEYIDGLPFTHMGMLGASAEFANKGIPYSNIFGGTFDTFSLGLDETKGEKNVAYTENDNVDYLNSHMPSYSRKMADAANLVYGCLTSEDFVASIENTKSAARDYSIYTKIWIPSVIAIGVIILAALSLIPIARRFEKKYPPKPPSVRKLKVAVFGMDYEDASSGDIFVDLRRKEGSGGNPDDPFGL